MAQVYAKSPQTGREYLVEISGETPTPSEEQRIIEYIGRQEGTYAPTFDEDLITTDKGSGTIANVAKGFGSGFLTSLANVPEGLTTFGETIAKPFGYDPDSNQFGETAESITDYLTGKIDTYVGRPDEDSVAGKIGQTFGSLGSFIVPGAGAAKGVSLLGGGIKAVRAAGIGTGITLGVGAGSKEQIDRLAQKIESGQEISDNDKDAAIFWGGLIGSSEAIALGRLLEPLVKIFKKVPRDKADDAVSTIKGALRRAGGTALLEGGQETLASIAQNLVAKNYYDPDLSLSDSFYGSAEEGIYGGGAAGVLDLLIGGRRKSSLSKLEKQFNELTEDQKQEAIEAEPKVQRAIQSLMGQINSDDGLLLLQDKTKLSEAIKREGLKPSEEKLVAQRLFDEIQRGNKVKTRPDLLKQIEELAKQNAVGNANTSFRTARGSKYYVQDDGTTIRDKKKKSAKDPDQTSGIQDKSIKTIYLNQKELDSLYSKTKGLQEFKGIELTPSGFLVQDLSKPLYSLSDSRDIVKAEVKASKVNEPKKGSYPVELFQRNGKMSIHVGNKITSVQPKPKSPYKLNQELNEIRKLESERQSAFSQLQGVESDIANFNQEENATSEKFREYENLRNELSDKINGINTRLKPKIAQFNTRYAKDLNIKQKPLSFDNLQAEANESRIASDQASKSEFTQEYQRTQQAVANSLRKKLKDLGLVDVDLVTKNVITPDEVLDIDGKTISPTDKKSSSELFRKFGLPEGFEMEGTEGKRIITLAMELYDPKLSAQELEAKIGSVLNHEIIHSIRALGLFKKEEWNALTKAAATRKYVRIINGKPTARSYSYLDRAQVMYGNQKNMTMDAIQEEAVAEMFRDYADGKIAMAGKPKSLFRRIYNFIRGIAESNYDADFKEASDIFELIRTKSDRQIGRRQRVPVSRTDARASITSFNRSLIKGIDYEGNKKDLDIEYDYIKPTKEFYDQLSIEDISKLSNTNLENLYRIDDVLDLDTDIPKDRELITQFDIRTKKYSNRFKTIQSIINEDPDFINAQADENAGLTLIENPDQYGTIVDDPRGSLAYKEAYLSSFDTIFDAMGLREKGYSYDYSNIPKAAILAFHGSPYNFDQFLTSKIGAGEGAQAFGYGLYFADSEGVATSYAYQNKVSINYKGDLIDRSYRKLKGSESRAIENTMYTNARFVDGLNQNFVKDFMSTYNAKLDVLNEIGERLDNPFQRLKKPKEAIAEAIDKAEKELAKHIAGAEFIDNLKSLEGYKRKSGLAFKHPKILVLKENIKELKKLDPNDFTKETVGDPRVYRVKLDTVEENLMDYDKLLGDQSETVLNGITEFTNDVFENPQYYNVDLYDMVANIGYDLNYDSNAIQKAKDNLLASNNGVASFLNTFEIATRREGFAEKNLYAFDIDGIMFDSGNTRGRPQGKVYLIKEKNTPSYGQDTFVDIDDNPVRFIKRYLKNPMILIANNKDSIDLPLTMQNVRDLNYEDIGIRDRIQDSLYNQSSQIKITDGKPISIREALNNFVRQETDKVISNLEEDNRNIEPRFRKSDPDKKTLPEAKIDEAKQDLNSFLNLTNEDLKIEEHKVEHNYVIFDDAIIKIDNKRKLGEDFIEERNETNPIADKDSEVSLSEALNDEQNKELESTREELKNFPKASLVATSPFSMVRSPVRNPKYPNIDDPRNYEYGYIYTQGSTRFKEGVPVAPILLTTGKDDDDAKLFNVTKDEEPTRYVQPFGLKNIENNNFNGLLFENSKYTSVERAIYDMLRKWQDQGYSSGEAVESLSGYDGAGINQPVSRIELLYKRPPRKSVPLKLNLLRAKTPENNTVWIVESLEPQIETKKRKGSVATVSPSVINASMLGQIQQRNTAIMYGGAAKTLSRILEVPLKLFYTDAEQKSKRIVDRFLINFQDSMLPVGQLLDDLRKNGLNISDGMDTYLQEELYHGIVGDKINTNEANLYNPLSSAVKNINLTESQINELKNTSTFARDYIENSKIPNLSIADIYLYALHAKERNDYILQNRDRTNDSGSGMTNQEADAILNWVNNLQPEQSLVFRDISNKAQDIIRNTNQVRFEGGLIPDFTQETTDSDGLPLPNYTNYVPLRGKFDIENDAVEESEPQIRITRARFGASGREDRRALGRDAENYGKDIVASLMMQNQNAIIRAERNKVGQSFLDLLESNPDETADVGFISETRPLRRGVSSTGYVRMMPDLLAQQDNNTFIVKRDGKEFYIKLYDDRIAQALKGTMNPSHANGLVKAMGKVSRWLSNVNTTYNPEFVVTNVIRDLQTAGVNVQQYNKDGVNQLASKIVSTTPKAWSGIKQALDIKIPLTNNDPNSEWALIYKDFVANGGQNAINQMGDLQDQINSIDKIVSDIGTNQGTLGKGLSKSKKLFSQVGSFLENVNTTAENGVRVATYKALIDSGMSKPRAAQAARNVTVNFSKGGEYKSAMNALYLFYNASLQGSFALLNAAARSPRVRKFWASAVVFGVMMDQLASLLSEEDEKTGQKKHDMIKDHILESNILIPYGGTTGNDYIKIPMPYGLNMAVNLGRVFSRSMRGEYTAGEAINSGLGVMVNTLNPIGGTPKFLGGEESVWNFIFPTVGDPIIDILENKDYKDSPVYKEASPFGLQQPASQRYWQSTSPLLIGASKFLAQDLPSVAEALGMGQKGTTVLPGSILGFETEVSPDVIQFWLEYATGGLGRFTLKALELPSVTIPKILEEGYSLPAISKGISENLRSIPFVSRVSGSLGSFEDTGSFIEGRDEVLLAFKELQEARKAQDETRYNRTLEKFAPQLTIVGKIKAINNARNRLIRKRNEIRKNPRVPQERKDLLITRINGKIEELTVTGNRVMREANVI